MIFSQRIARRIAAASLAIGLTASIAVAATVHRAVVSTATGSLGATTFLQNTVAGGALQGEVASTANSGIKIPFGMLGEYDAANSTTFGVGAIGISTTGYGLAGTSTSGTQPSIIAFPSGDGPGLEALSSSTSSLEALYAEAKGSGDGIISYADGDGNGLLAQASGRGAGVVGIALGRNYGIVGYNYSTGGGIYGTSSTGDGVIGDVTNASAGVHAIQEPGGSGFGIRAEEDQVSATPAPTSCPCAFAGTYSQSFEGPGLYGVNLSNSGKGIGQEGGSIAQNYAGVFGFGNQGPGVFAYGATGIGAYVESNGGNDSSGRTLPTLFVENQNGTAGNIGSSFYAYNDATGQYTIAYSNGNFYTTGAVMSGTNTFTNVQNPNSDMATYAAQSAEATVEDIGSAELLNGTASVRLPADLREAIDTQRSYAVFITPYGDNRGLYVTSRTAAGFTVKETQGGRSTLAFDYRIVARPYGAAQARLPHMAQLHRLPQRPARRSFVHSNGASPRTPDVRASAGAGGWAPTLSAQRNNALRRGALPAVPSSLSQLSQAKIRLR